MLKIKESVVVEGAYDKIKLSNIVSANIIAVNGFNIFSDDGMIGLLKALAKKDGIIILTDSDRAGFAIRNYITDAVKEGAVKQAYIPDVHGKERRKKEFSKEGKLGVEGVKDEDIIKALSSAAPKVYEEKEGTRAITLSDLYEDSFAGKQDSFSKRQKLLEAAALPKRMSTRAMLGALNALYTFEEYGALVRKLHQI